MKDFFISYTGADQQWAEWIALQLHYAGYTTIVQAWDFHVGGNFVLEMHRATTESSRTLAVLSQRYLDALFTNPEWVAAFAKDPRGEKRLLVPVRIEDFKPDGLFKALIYLDLVGLSESDAKKRLLTKIATTIQGLSAKPVKVAFPGTASSSVSKGLRYPGTPPEVCNLPRRNANFTGRESILESLSTALQSGQKTAITQQAIYGLGGIGKTQLALEYAWRHSSAYDIVWWLRAEDASTLSSDYTALATKLNLPKKDAKRQVIVIEAVKEWLDHHSGWLLIFDNAREFGAISNYLPNAPSGHALITSRNQNWNNSFCTPLEIKVWSRDESIAFLQKRTGQSDDRAADALAKTLGDLSLALEQAAAFCVARQKSFAEYLDLFASRRAELWKREKHPDNYPDTVATTWSLAFRAVERVSWATDILNLCALFAPDAIPRTLMTKALTRYAKNKGVAEPVDTMQIDDAIEALSIYSLVKPETEQLSIHRLVQTVAQERMSPTAKEHYCVAAIKALCEQFPTDCRVKPACWPECAVLMPHVETLTNSLRDAVIIKIPF